MKENYLTNIGNEMVVNETVTERERERYGNERITLIKNETHTSTSTVYDDEMITLQTYHNI